MYHIVIGVTSDISSFFIPFFLKLIVACRQWLYLPELHLLIKPSNSDYITMWMIYSMLIIHNTIQLLLIESVKTTSMYLDDGEHQSTGKLHGVLCRK